MRNIQFRLRTVFVVLSIACLALGGVAWLNYRMNAFFSAVVDGNNGLVTEVADWPRPLRELASRAQEEDIALNDVHVYCIAKGLAVEYVWRIESAPGLFELMRKEFELYDDNRPHETMNFGRLPEWWDPQDDENSQYYAGRSSNIGDKGDKFRVYHDEKRQLVYVYYDDNW